MWDLHSQKSQLDDYDAQLLADAKHVKVAQATVAKVSYAKPWGDTDPLSVACLSELAKALPEDGQVFLTSFNLTDARKGSIAAHASSSAAALAVADKLQSSGHFADLHMSSIDSPRKPAGKQAPKAPEQPPAQPPPQMPQMPAVMPTPPGAPGAGGQPGVVVMSPTLAMVNGEPQANPAALQMAMANQASGAEAAARADAMAKAMAMGAMPPGAMPPGQPPQPPQEKPSKKSRGGGGQPGEGGAPSSGGASAGGGEVTFVMTFNYVPKK